MHPIQSETFVNNPKYLVGKEVLRSSINTLQQHVQDA